MIPLYLCDLVTSNQYLELGPAHGQAKSFLRWNAAVKRLEQLGLLERLKQASSKDSVANVLQKPFRRNLPAEAGILRQLVDFAGHCVELCALQIAPFRISDLVHRDPALHPTGGEVGERDPPVWQRVAVLAAPTSAVAVLSLLGPRLIPEVLGIGGE